jgi:CheY-like chemotaxis protein
MKILVVDDSLTMRRIIVNSLNRLASKKWSRPTTGRRHSKRCLPGEAPI